MTRRLTYSGIAVLCGLVAYAWGARSAQADWAKDKRIWGVVPAAGDTFLILSQNGEAWLHDAGTWTRRAELDPPVPAGTVKFFEGRGDTESFLLVTVDDEVWSFTEGRWTRSEPFTGGPVELDPGKWGDYKAHGS